MKLIKKKIKFQLMLKLTKNLIKFNKHNKNQKFPHGNLKVDIQQQLVKAKLK